MPVVVKEFTFDAAHQLVGHCGKCSRIHGHTYRLRVAVEGPVKTEDGSDKGMVIDFGDLKKIVQERVINLLDHKFIACGDEPIIQLFDEDCVEGIVRDSYGVAYESRDVFGEDGVIIIGKRTTAENIAEWIFYRLMPYIKNLAYIELHETPTSFVRVTNPLKE